MYPEDKQKEVPYPMSRKNPFVMPILKWVGGKRQLLDSINPLIPECSTYYEPFIGGGAVLFGRQPNKAVINAVSYTHLVSVVWWTTLCRI